MPRENVRSSTNLSIPSAFDGSERRTIASYEHELTEHRDTEIRLRQALAEHQALLVQKDEPRSQKSQTLSISNKGSDLPEGFDPMASRGLGMSLVCALTKQIGGELRIDRGDRNDCTRFTLFFS